MTSLTLQEVRSQLPASWHRRPHPMVVTRIRARDRQTGTFTLGARVPPPLVCVYFVQVRIAQEGHNSGSHRIRLVQLTVNPAISIFHLQRHWRALEEVSPPHPANRPSRIFCRQAYIHDDVAGGSRSTWYKRAPVWLQPHVDPASTGLAMMLLCMSPRSRRA